MKSKKYFSMSYSIAIAFIVSMAVSCIDGLNRPERPETDDTETKTEKKSKSKTGSVESGDAASSGTSTFPSSSTGSKQVASIDTTNASKYTPIPANVALQSKDCQNILGLTPEEAKSKDTIMLGALLPLTGTLWMHGKGMQNGIEMALSEINQSGGILGKKVGVIGCDDGSSPGKGIESAKHLVSLKVPAIIGASGSNVTIEVFNQVIKGSSALLISPSSTSPAITHLQDGNLLWRTVPSDAIQGSFIGKHLTQKGYRKIAIINRNDTYGNGIRDVVVEYLINKGFNTDDAGKFYNAGYPPDNYAADLDAIAVKIGSFAPDIIVILSWAEDGKYLLKSLGNKNINIASTDLLLSDGLRSDELLKDDLPNPIKCKIFGTIPASPSSAVYNSFKVRYRSQYDNNDPSTYSAQSYDAVFVLAYAIAGVSDNNYSAVRLAEGLSRLSSGAKVNAGMTDFNGTIQMLRNNPKSTMDYVGASGELDFTADGEPAKSAIRGWALDLDRKEVFEFKDEILTEDGTYRIPWSGARPGTGAACN
ncbi:MAG: ABC transporter substrate-binding protein [Oligoflexales bacterium]|nr:ABC transporter substrate-binding protein [Oligoflexales bacterium]